MCKENKAIQKYIFLRKIRWNVLINLSNCLISVSECLEGNQRSINVQLIYIITEIFVRTVQRKKNQHLLNKYSVPFLVPFCHPKVYLKYVHNNRKIISSNLSHPKLLNFYKNIRFLLKLNQFSLIFLRHEKSISFSRLHLD